MGHGIFLRNFDGPQKFFLCASFLIFFVISFKKLWGQNVYTNHQGDSKKNKGF